MKKTNKSIGLGDTIEKFTHATGLDKAAKAIAKLVGEEDCGCERRKDKLNDLVPYNKKDKQDKDDK
jgi:hypothetical protein